MFMNAHRRFRPAGLHGTSFGSFAGLFLRGSLIVALVALLYSPWSGCPVSAQTLSTTLANFDLATGGIRPYAGLVQGSDGNFYGTTNLGGASANCSGGCGTVFRVTPTGTLTTLVNFNFTNGANPYSGLVLGSDGNFYGTTFYGGSSTSCGSSGCGTVFRMTPSGALTTLVSFEPTSPNGGANPYAGLLQASDENFYGTTLYGGGSSANCDSRGCGTVFRMTSGGTLTTLVNLTPALGSKPYAGLIQASDGNFYGTTGLGGSSANCGTSGCGTVFRLTPSGTLTTLVNFNGSSSGASPFGTLVQGSDGNFFGTTLYGGGIASSCDSRGCGTIFRLTPSGTLTNLSLNPATGGTSPYTGLVQGRDDNFYSTTFSGGSSTSCGTNGCGTVFRITPSGIITTLFNFNPANSGTSPYAGLVQGRDGNFYGTTTFGGISGSCGSDGCGTIFRLNLNLGYRFYPVSPCRIADTRNTSSPSLPINAPISFVVNAGGTTFNYSAQGGNALGCGIPTEAKAVFFNFVAVNSTGSGYLQAWPFGTAIPTASILNYATASSLNIANGIILPVCDPSITTCSKDLNVQANQSSIQLVLDIVGYFK